MPSKKLFATPNIKDARIALRYRGARARRRRPLAVEAVEALRFFLTLCAKGGARLFWKTMVFARQGARGLAGPNILGSGERERDTG